MGLDLYLYRATKSADMNIEIDWDNMEELSYGRKTWSIYYKFKECGATRLNEDSDAVLVVTPLVYERFINCILEAMDRLNLTSKKLRKALKAVQKWSLSDEDLTDDDTRFRKSISRLADFLNEWTDIPPQLGTEWEVAAILRWFADKDKVRAVFEEGYNVILVASY